MGIVMSAAAGIDKQNWLFSFGTNGDSVECSRIRIAADIFAHVKVH